MSFAIFLSFFAITLYVKLDIISILSYYTLAKIFEPHVDTGLLDSKLRKHRLCQKFFASLLCTSITTATCCVAATSKLHFFGLCTAVHSLLFCNMLTYHAFDDKS